MLFQDKMLRADRAFPLDILRTSECHVENGSTISEAQIARETTLKNVVMQVINKVRIKKKKPTLSKLLEHFKNSANKVPKDVVINKLY